MTTSFARRMSRVQPSAIRELLQLGDNPNVISFGGGYPDSTLFPYEELCAAAQTALVEDGAASLQYTSSNGTPQLRAQIAARMTRQGTPCSADDVLILHGGQQGLDLVAKLFLNPGDVVITENPTFLGALIAFNPCEPNYVAIGMDEDGMDMNQLEQALLTTPNAKLIYTVPDFHNPTGVTMSLARRHELIGLANRFNLIILEDTPYREIRFAGESLPTLKSLDTEDRVIYLGTFSKILAPALRIGWTVASPAITHQLGLLKLAADTQCSTLNMKIISLFLEQNDIEAHIDLLRDAYRRKCDVMLRTMAESFPDTVTWTKPNGGLFTWLTFPVGFDAADFMRNQLLPHASVAYVPGAPFFAVNPVHNHARVNFSSQSDSRIVQGVTAMGALLKTPR